jgi:hypothetical protein
MPGVLVACATKHGSTREVAEAVSKTLRAEGVQVDLRPARGVRGPIGDRIWSCWARRSAPDDDTVPFRAEAWVSLRGLSLAWQLDDVSRGQVSVASR